MKSKIKFDLNSQDQAVVSAQIVYSDDVRDKVARTFYEKLGYVSNLAYVEIHPDSDFHDGSFPRVNPLPKQKNIEIKTFSGDPESTAELCKNLCLQQLETLLDVIPKEFERRNKLNGVTGA